MLRLRRLLVSCSLLASVAGAGCQSYSTGMLTLCDAPKNCTTCSEVPPDKRDRAIAEYVGNAVRNADATAVFESLHRMSAKDRVTLLRAEAQKAGLAGCGLADKYEADAKGSPAGTEP